MSRTFIAVAAVSAVLLSTLAPTAAPARGGNQLIGAPRFTTTFVATGDSAPRSRPPVRKRPHFNDAVSGAFVANPCAHILAGHC
jgi:hypothetical protein